jgi:hypothetical protein
MGTDIHPRVQVHTEEGWQDIPISEYPEAIWNRDYRLFGILANVRNGVGFAGIKYGSPAKPISQERGLPPDVKARLKDGEENAVLPIEGRRYRFMREDEPVDSEYWLGYHDFTWVTLDELLKYNWTQSLWNRGCVAWDEYVNMQTDGRTVPEVYCGDVSGPLTIKLDAIQAGYTYAELQRRKREGRTISFGDLQVYVQLEWLEPIDLDCAGFTQDVMPWLKSLTNDPTKVRIVMGFDS